MKLLAGFLQHIAACIVGSCLPVLQRTSSCTAGNHLLVLRYTSSCTAGSPENRLGLQHTSSCTAGNCLPGSHLGFLRYTCRCTAGSHLPGFRFAHPGWFAPGFLQCTSAYIAGSLQHISSCIDHSCLPGFLQRTYSCTVGNHLPDCLLQRIPSCTVGSHLPCCTCSCTADNFQNGQRL